MRLRQDDHKHSLPQQLSKTMIKKLLFSTMALFGLTLASGCSDQSNPAGPMDDMVVVANNGTGPQWILWEAPLSQDVSTSKACQADAVCKLRINNPRVDVRIPVGALSQDTEITVTALAGNVVNLSFAPHGTQFAVPIRVDVHVGSSPPSGPINFFAAYWDGDLDNVLETFPAVLKKGKLRFEPDHFSGYAMAF